MGSVVHNNEIFPEQDGEGKWGVEMVDNESLVMKKRSGAHLTWEDLRVSVSSSNGSSCKTILSGATGYAKPGEIVAIMGPSGCGKSTLLDSLAGRLATNIRSSGHVLINGRKQRLTYGTMAYMTQEQVLTWTLTVKETVYYSAELQLPKSMPRSQKRERADRIIREMGLQESMNTRIGGWGIKGLSGGQKRRLSICLQLLTHPKLLLLDEPTSGLDSAASYYVMDRIVKLTQQYGMTVLAAIHQPSSHVFGLFHNLCLLSLGRMIYFGPTFAANQFFAANGFPCPDLQNPADHFLITINTDFDEDHDSGHLTVEKVVDVLSESYKSSDIYMDVKSEIAATCGQEGGLTGKAGFLKAGFITQCWVLVKRSFINMYRDIGYYWLRLGIYIVLGFSVGTVFYNLGYGFGSLNGRISMLMYISSFLTIMAIGGFPSFIEEFKVFQWERLNGHYGVGSFVISHAISSTPYLLLLSFIPGVIAYSLVGLQREYEQFTYFALVLFASMLLVECLMMIVATIVPNLLMGIITGAGIQGMMILSAGFFRLPDDLAPVFWKYPMYHVSFHKYALQGLYKNEFHGLMFPEYEGGPKVNGDMLLKDLLQVEMGYSKWVDLGIIFGMVFVYRVILFCIIKTTERVKPIIRAILFSAT
ncbi:putative ABC-type lipopolysaccharide transporter [Helianthus annuus]|nr:putative ABC-type lipopolysaccharide transporter [Helianthus annuus]KAJ0641058.1 putative ABC-type lipopolysaccharide transporter [Helianthus annuus]KAJ0644980.1 putative ABC-type lipopolysaccharide transporter [Helianthus annuus]KAJ0821410.1 putative ABC-type lipopolysaccharide transporter [Helianthus annuus]KAJ0836094.1 putative ABC-type lipopolysaccharide transporter [Helianthus annuus]